MLLVVDQMRADYVEKFGHNWTGGLRRLMNEGAWFREAAYRHIATVTCVGHTTIVTGSLPRTHGIVGNDLWDREAGKGGNCVADPETTLVSYGQPAKGTATSTRNLRVPTLADEMRAQLSAADAHRVAVAEGLHRDVDGRPARGCGGLDERLQHGVHVLVGVRPGAGAVAGRVHQGAPGRSRPRQELDEAAAGDRPTCMRTMPRGS